MVGQITSVLAAYDINITDMINKSKSKTAYTMIDTDGGISNDVITEISNIEDVIRVRLIY